MQKQKVHRAGSSSKLDGRKSVHTDKAKASVTQLLSEKCPLYENVLLLNVFASFSTSQEMSCTSG